MARLPISMPSLWPRYVALDLRPDAVAWAEARYAFGGFRLAACGEEPRAEGERPPDLIARVVKQLDLARAHVRVPIRHPELRIQRIELPDLSDRDARGVAARRSAELAEGLGEPGIAAYALSSQRTDRSAWMVGLPEEFVRFAEGQWETLGLEVAAFDTLQLALGSVSHWMPPPPEGELRALFDIGPAHATCVFADAEGWIFHRDISLKLITEVGVDGHDRGDASERILTELRRTFQYVETELRLGTVGEVVISGGREDLYELVEPLTLELGRETRMLGEVVAEGPAAGASPGLAVVLGAVAGCASPRGGNLLPREVAHARRSQRLERRLGASVLWLGCLALAGLAYVWMNLSSLSDASAQMESAWAALAGERAAVERTEAARGRATSVAEALDALEGADPPWPQALDAIGVLLPEDALLLRLSARRDAADAWVASLDVEFRGADMAEAASEVSNFAARLTDSPLWAVRTLERTTAPPAGEPEAGARVHFRLEAALAPDAGHGLSLDGWGNRDG
ncbi:MAG: hypothetical protein AAF430_11790 [Myxococcota bacterium]